MRKTGSLKHRMWDMKQSVPTSVDEYIAGQPEVVLPKLEQVRAAIRRLVPDTAKQLASMLLELASPAPGLEPANLALVPLREFAVPQCLDAAVASRVVPYSPVAR